MRREAYRLAEATPYLGGARIHRINPSLLGLALIVAFVVTLLGVVTGADPHPLMLAAPMVVVFVPLVVLRFYVRAGVRLNNDGVQALQRDDTDAAAAGFRATATGYYLRDTVVMALHNLGVIALRRRDFEGAAALFRAAIEASRGFRFGSTPDYYQSLARSQLAFTLAILQDTRGAEVELAAMGALPPTSLAIAYAVRACAMIAARRGQWPEVVRVLDAEHALLRNVLVASEAVLAEALESYALARIAAGSPAAATRPSEPVLADAEARAYVRGILPEAESVLAGA